MKNIYKKKIRKDKIFFLGGSGFVGKSFFEKYRNKVNLIITYNNKKIKKYKKFNILKENINSLIKKYGKPKTIIYAVGSSNQDFCYKNQSLSKFLNVTKAKQQIDIVKKYPDVHFIFLSSQMVLSGQKAFSDEKCKPNPKLVYGKQKLEVENYIKKKIKNYTILRLSKVYGTNLKDKTILTTFLKNIIKGEKIYNLAFDQFFNPLFIGDLVKILFFFHKNKSHKQVFHIGGPERISRYNLLKYFYNKLNISQKKNVFIKRKKLNTIFKTEVNPLDTSFNIKKIKKTINFDLTSYKDSFKTIIEKLA